MTERQDIECLMSACAAAPGDLDVLVNNASIASPTAPVETLDRRGKALVLG